MRFDPSDRFAGWFAVVVLTLVAILVMLGVSDDKHRRAAMAVERAIEYNMYGQVRTAQIVSSGTETGVWTMTYVGFDTDDKKFIQMDIPGADMRFAAGLHVRVKFHRDPAYMGHPIVVDDVERLQ